MRKHTDHASGDDHNGPAVSPPAFGGGTTWLEHHFLIAMPQLQDPNFHGTVTYLWKHDEHGALGVVINRPSALPIAEMLEELKITVSDQVVDRLTLKRVLAGGPVEKNKGFILHEAGNEWEYTLPINDEVSMSMSRDILQDIANGAGPSRYIAALGCAGWDAGQLEQEISDNVWLTVPADTALLFSEDHEGMANAAANLLGVSLSQLATVAGHS